MIMLLFMVFSVVLGAVWPLAGDKELPGEATASESIVRFMWQLYRRRLSSGPEP
ncbi:hypothetical protein HU200_051133 [Digitaria exilis]|uniref:Uncharacterized protein n=1 Tax=Digitaria exilis TaxID=1010633 RepID=A0A835AR96_9POAL|nr:hypothetical protein HU200_051133 [Digitaria exilis]